MRNSNDLVTTEKVVMSGTILETFLYSKAFTVKKSRKLGNTTQNKAVAFRRLVNANSGQWYDDKRMVEYLPLFLTLTFADNVQNFDIANHAFKLFIKRLNRLFFKGREKVAYIAVPEFQERGAIHYHIIFFNLGYIADFFHVFSDLWGLGFVIIKPMKEASETGWYMAKYMSKSMKDDRFDRKKRYFYSRNLLKPIVIYDIKMIGEIMELVNSEPRYHTVFDSYNGGDCEYSIYDISDSPLRTLPQFAFMGKRVSEDRFVEDVDIHIQGDLFTELSTDRS